MPRWRGARRGRYRGGIAQRCRPVALPLAALPGEIRRRVLHRPLLAEVGDTLAQPRHQVAQAAVRFAQQQSPAVRRHPPTIAIRDHVALAVRLELQLLRRAPCFHEPSL